MEKRSGAGDAADAAEADTMRVLLLPLPSPPLLRPPLFLRDRSGLPGFSTCGSVYLTAPVLGIGGLTKTWCALSLVPVGTALLLEKESRRKEIAAYCSARALESFLVCSKAFSVPCEALVLSRWGREDTHRDSRSFLERNVEISTKSRGERGSGPKTPYGSLVRLGAIRPDPGPLRPS